MTELRTARLLLRRARWDDLAGLHAALSDPRSTTYWSTPPHESLGETEKWLASMIQSPPGISEDFVIVEQGEPIGKIGAWRLPEIGFLLRSDRWGRGLATEAMAAFLPHVFARPEVDRLTADVDPRNAASLALLKRHGFVETGRAKATWHTHLGACDSIYLELRRDAALRTARRANGSSDPG